MDKQEGFHAVDEQVISPLHSSLIQAKIRYKAKQARVKFVIKFVKEEKGRPNQGRHREPSSKAVKGANKKGK